MTLAPATKVDNLTIFSDIPCSDVVRINFGGPITVGDVVGFQYQFNWSGTHFNELVVYTIKLGDNWSQIVNGVLAALIANNNITGVWNAEGCPENAVTAAYYNINGNQLVFNQSWPMVTTSVITPYVAGAGTETVSVNSLGDQLEGYPFLAFGRDVAGRGFKPKDLVGGMLWFGPDSSGGPYPYILASDKRGFPYVQFGAQIKNATWGAWDAALGMTFGNDGSSIVFEKRNISINGQPCASVDGMAPYAPTVTCGSGAAMTLGAVTGFYRTLNKETRLNINIPIVALNGAGSAGDYIKVSLPPGILPAAIGQQSTIGGRENARTGKILTSVLNPNQPWFAIANDDGTFAGLAGGLLTIGGDLVIS